MEKCIDIFGSAGNYCTSFGITQKICMYGGFKTVLSLVICQKLQVKGDIPSMVEY